MRFLSTFSKLLILAVVLASISTIPVSAQQHSSIGISPLRQETIINPGFVYSGSLVIRNNGDQTQQVDLNVETFNVTNQSYDYLFKTDTVESSWVTFDRNELLLKADETTTVSYKVSVPLDTEPAGYYLALFALNHPSEDTSGGITPTERVASLLYITVSGDATRSGNLVKLTSPFVVFTEGGWSATLQNTGTLHYRSKYSSTVTSVFGQQVGLKEDSRLILPSSVRLVEDSIPLPLTLGVYKVTYTVSLGDTPAHSEERWILYVPPIQTALIIAIIISMVYLLSSSRKKR